MRIYSQQKYLLYQRLRNTDPEPTKVRTLLELLRPNLRMAMRPSNPQTLAALMTRAMQAFPQGLSSPCAETS